MKDSLLEDLKNLLIDSIDSKYENKLSEGDITVETEETVEDVLLASPKDQSYRIYDEEECAKLDLTCRDFLLRIEQLQLVGSEQRELIIDKLMQSDTIQVTMDEVRWTVLNALDDELSEEQLLFLDYVLNEEKPLKH